MSDSLFPDLAAASRSSPFAPVLAGRWIAQIGEEPLDLAMRLTFRDGKVFDGGMPIGAYELCETHMVAATGTDTSLVITARPDAQGHYLGEMITSFADDEDLRETATLFPDPVN